MGVKNLNQKSSQKSRTRISWRQLFLSRRNLPQSEFIEPSETQTLLQLAYQEMQGVWALIEQREALTKAIFDASQDAILTLNQNAEVIELNHATEILFDLPSAQILGKSIFDLLKENPFLEDLRKCILQSENSFCDFYLGKAHERSILTLAGKEIIISVSPNRVQTGANFIYPLYIRDLTIAKQTEKELLEARSKFIMVSKMSALGEMAGGVAHEINNPLTIIQMRTDQLLNWIKTDRFDPQMATKALRTIDFTVNRISRIVSSLRAFSRDGSADPVASSSLLRIFEDTFNLCREKFSSQGVDLELNCPANLKLKCRHWEISQVLLNFLNNSFDAVQEQEQKWVKIEAVESPTEIEIHITDSGHGIPPAVQEKMMQPFFTTKEIGKGSGLGLSISKGIIESHRGRLEYDSKSPNTKFSLFFPKPKNPAAGSK